MGVINGSTTRGMLTIETQFHVGCAVSISSDSLLGMITITVIPSALEC